MRLHVISDEADPLLSQIARRCASPHRVSSLVGLRELLVRLEQGSTTVGVARVTGLDLIGHSTRGHHYLRLGDAAVDMLDRRVARFFDDLARSGVLRRLGIDSLRLLGCETALEVAGQRTIRLLAARLGIRVYGARTMIGKSHYDGTGFAPSFEHLLIDAADLPIPLHRLEPIAKASPRDLVRDCCFH